MLFAIVSFGSAVLAGLVFLIHGISNAPLGEQTAEEGFLMSWCNDRPEYRNVSCIWTPCEA